MYVGNAQKCKRKVTYNEPASRASVERVRPRDDKGVADSPEGHLLFVIVDACVQPAAPLRVLRVDARLVLNRQLEELPCHLQRIAH